jgi:hypothetical protein
MPVARESSTEAFPAHVDRESVVDRWRRVRATILTTASWVRPTTADRRAPQVVLIIAGDSDVRHYIRMPA